MVYDSSVEYKDAVIANAGTDSNAIACGFARAASLTMPAAWTAATLGVKVSTDGGTTYNTLYTSDGVAYEITAQANSEILLNVVEFLGITDFKLISSAAQGAERTIRVTLIP